MLNYETFKDSRLQDLRSLTSSRFHVLKASEFQDPRSWNCFKIQDFRIHDSRLGICIDLWSWNIEVGELFKILEVLNSSDLEILKLFKILEILKSWILTAFKTLKSWNLEMSFQKELLLIFKKSRLRNLGNLQDSIFQDLEGVQDFKVSRFQDFGILQNLQDSRFQDFANSQDLKISRLRIHIKLPVPYRAAIYRAPIYIGPYI